ncbi:MAG: phosphotransferase [Anaerolineales bacterium]|nr:phosphotransferase [Anaerolineales bacterium]
MNSTTPFDPGRIRVLIVNNDAMSSRMLRHMLTASGYQVSVAEGFGQRLIEDTLKRAHSFWPHIALIDLRIAFASEHDRYHHDDLSGLALIDQLGSSVHCILISSWLTPRISVAAIKNHGAFDVIGLNNDFGEAMDIADELLLSLKKAASERSAGGRRVTFSWNNIMLDGLRRHMGTEAVFDLHELVEDLLVQLFPEATTLLIDPVVTGQGSASANRQHSVVLVVRTAADRMPIIVKFGPVQRMAQERERYQQHIQSQLPLFYAELQKYTEFWGLGATRYSFLGLGGAGNRLPSLADYFHQSEDPTALMKPIHHFLGVVWQKYYATRQEPALAETLFGQYDAYLHLRERMEQALATAEDQRSPRIALIRWLSTNWALAGPAGPAAITHGDLHADNLFVDMDGRSWAIDFERTSQGPILRDFAELETDIVTRLTNLSSDDPAFASFIQALLESHTLALPLLEPPVVEAHKSLHTIACIRQLAAELTGSDPVRYWWALLYHAIFVLLIKPDASHAEIFAAALIAKLETIYQEKGT